MAFQWTAGAAPPSLLSRKVGQQCPSDGARARDGCLRPTFERACPVRPAFALDRRPATARYFIELIVLPMMMRALFGEDLAALRAEIGSHVARTGAFFLPPAGRAELDKSASATQLQIARSGRLAGRPSGRV